MPKSELVTRDISMPAGVWRSLDSACDSYDVSAGEVVAAYVLFYRDMMYEYDSPAMGRKAFLSRLKQGVFD